MIGNILISKLSWDNWKSYSYIVRLKGKLNTCFIGLENGEMKVKYFNKCAQFAKLVLMTHIFGGSITK
jgi:hypothetical protein